MWRAACLSSPAPTPTFAACPAAPLSIKVCSFVKELRLFYPDLQDADYESAIGMVHSRFSTNTSPSWNRAHPNRFILHNGEINTIRGNVDTMLAREETISVPTI